MKNKNRYKGKLNDEYGVIMRAWPHEKKIRLLLAGVISKYVTKKIKSINILELGSGSGESTEYILKALKGLKISYDSVDNDKKLIDKQSKNLKSYLGILFPVTANGLNYLHSLPSNNVDIFTASWFLHNFKKLDRDKIIKEIYRILKPGGLFAVMDKYVPDDQTEEEKLHYKQIKRFRLFKDEVLEKVMISHEEEDRSPQYIMKELESLTVMKNIGFRKLKIVKRYVRDVVLVGLK